MDLAISNLEVYNALSVGAFENALTILSRNENDFRSRCVSLEITDENSFNTGINKTPAGFKIILAKGLLRAASNLWDNSITLLPTNETAKTPSRSAKLGSGCWQS